MAHAGMTTFYARCGARRKRSAAMLGTILIVVLVLALIGALPNWPHSRNWGYLPGGLLGALVLATVVLLLLGRI
jgi:uncharacterized membrane protein YdcZ (DUF606 family)